LDISLLSGGRGRGLHAFTAVSSSPSSSISDISSLIIAEMQRFRDREELADTAGSAFHPPTYTALSREEPPMYPREEPLRPAVGRDQDDDDVEWEDELYPNDAIEQGNRRRVHNTVQPGEYRRRSGSSQADSVYYRDGDGTRRRRVPVPMQTQVERAGTRRRSKAPPGQWDQPRGQRPGHVRVLLVSQGGRAVSQRMPTIPHARRPVSSGTIVNPVQMCIVRSPYALLYRALQTLC